MKCEKCDIFHIYEEFLLKAVCWAVVAVAVRLTSVQCEAGGTSVLLPFPD